MQVKELKGETVNPLMSTAVLKHDSSTLAERSRHCYPAIQALIKINKDQGGFDAFFIFGEPVPAVHHIPPPPSPPPPSSSVVDCSFSLCAAPSLVHPRMPVIRHHQPVHSTRAWR
jgi:hypothetical protein